MRLIFNPKDRVRQLVGLVPSVEGSTRTKRLSKVTPRLRLSHEDLVFLFPAFELKLAENSVLTEFRACRSSDWD